MNLAPFLLLAETGEHALPLSLPWAFLLIAFLLLLNGYFVALEFALVAVRKTRIDQMVREGVRGAASVKRGKEKVDDFVATAQLGITVASLAIGRLIEPAVVAVIQQPFHDHLGIEITGRGGLGFALGLGIGTILHVVLGEQVPKMLAIQQPTRLALWLAPPAEILLTICRPFVWFLSALTHISLKPFGVQADGGHHDGPPHSEEEIRDILTRRLQAGLAEEAENQMIARVFNFFDMSATQIMIPRTEMVFVPGTANVREVMRIASEEGHDRYPVYGENIDEIVGILLLKDLVSFIAEEPDSLDRPVDSLLREALCVPGSVSGSALMTQMREQHTRLAIVLDEYGGTAGMVTLGDVLERIVGEVDEETEELEMEDVVELAPNLYSVSGLLLTEDIEELFESKIEDEHNDTIGGVVFSQLGRRPEVGDEVRLNGLVFRVERLDGLRIDRLRVRLEPDD